MRYAIVIETARRKLSAYVPDLPGCVATGETLPLVRTAIRRAIELHLSGMREDGIAIPIPSSQVHHVDIADGARDATPKLSDWDTCEFLLTPEDVRGYLDECFTSFGDDAVFLERACRIGADALQRMNARSAATDA
ncbi:type II toxin-antitoxin system HicB family antitoxin [Chiayiivirga flava]|uniref:Putative RNase H-like HicB family nuclease n=1 Tax=Chiayiivirga flava TaxID=659595 RepID=A0A7W8G0D4_9GAMM|nr:type II toxin-antitoxin system HicB family antitoxin [Chiayiivirga flava]MBB5207623.1 putative RNase H-like HicB family nuclease [Chiayiivirga flava]